MIPEEIRNYTIEAIGAYKQSHEHTPNDIRIVDIFNIRMNGEDVAQLAELNQNLTKLLSRSDMERIFGSRR